MLRNTIISKRQSWIPALCLLFFLIQGNPVAKTAHLAILQGFSNANIGYEINANRFLAKLLFAGGSIGENNFDLRGDFHLGRIFPYANGIEFAGTIGCKFEYSFMGYSKTNFERDYSAIPSVNVLIRKFFGRFLVGGNVGLDLCRLYDQARNDYATGWHESQMLNINPELAIGFLF